MVDVPPVSRRAFLTAGGGLLASIGVGALLPEAAQAAQNGQPAGLNAAAGQGATAGQSATDLALYRPVQASSTDYAPTQANFAVDGLPQLGVKGSGWRATQGDPQWISVDLQAVCRVDAITLTFEAKLTDPPFDGNYNNADGDEILSSAAVAYRIETSIDGKAWTSVYETDSGQGGVNAITLSTPVQARHVRMTATKRHNTNPLGLNGFQVYGTAPRRTEASGWTDWAGRNTKPAPTLTVGRDGTVALESGWSLTMDDLTTNDGVALSTGHQDVKDWLPATVPGTVLATLVEQGHLPDPVGGFENLRIPEALSRHAWWYRREFKLPRALRGKRVWLEYDGINHEATTWVNGVSVGTVTHPFARGVLDVTEALKGHDEHTIAVKITPMPHPGTPGDKSLTSWTFLGGGSLYLDSPTYLAVSGWDWMPAVRDRVSGIWNHVRLRGTGDVVIGDAHVTTKLADRRTATLTVTVPVRNVAAEAVTVTVRASLLGKNLEKTVTLDKSEMFEVVLAPLSVKNPKLWWPNGYGDPILNDLKVTATIGKETSDTRTTKFGIREFSYDWDQPVVISPPAVPPLTFDNGKATQTVTFDRQHKRYVRIQADQRATGWGVSMWSLEVHDGGTGPDQALHHTATAKTEADGTTAAAVTDGDPNTRWTSEYADDQWIQVDLGAAADFDRVTILWESAYAMTFRVQVSDDGGAFTDLKTVSNETPIGNTGKQVVDFPAQTAQFVRIQGHKRATDWGFSMWTLAVLNNGADLAKGKTATASSAEDSNPPSNAVDGNPRTRWASQAQDDQWIQVDLGAPQTFSQVEIDWESAYARTFVIQVSQDGRAWTDVKAVDNAAIELKISVNGVPVFARGGNWGWDELLRRTEPYRTRETVKMHRDMNFTMIRNWIGSSNREELYAACDEYGILVWNDFWEAGAFIDSSPTYDAIVADTISRYRHHPSIAVWCGANEQFPPGGIDAGLRKAVADLDPEIIYVPSSNAGIVSGSGPWNWIDPDTYADPNQYKAGVLGFHTEIGMPVIPHAETMRNLVGDEPEWPISQVWGYHDWATNGNQHVDYYQKAIEDRLGVADNLDQFTSRAQFVNYENHRAMFEAWNASLFQNASGLLLWMSHPAWYSTVWQTYDYDLDVNGAYYGARKSCEPRHVQADPGSWTVRAVNHTPDPVTGVLTAKAYDLSGRQIGTTQTQTVSVASSSTTPAFTLPSINDFHLVRLEWRDKQGKLISENTYWRYAQPSDMRILSELPKTRLTVDDGTVTNRGKTVAALVRVAVRDGHGNRVLPAEYSDNYFWLLPGESRKVHVSWPERLGNPKGLTVTAEAYNS
ncbi:glycoside hydrolase [Actinoplanes sp. TBRC 11911]|uniref:discoidin domain-containing protein n=1 Tax=Actinoplanes sp. TBRC 11911 TaxID=2729386 RepID=UPI00145E3025|nr:discoidin domain-containing protein [Actinoplanes sp. TBRC 11911]NMO57327.1 glycoside hydrolase [Actinoplanes sp. TBRC 11911]